MRDDLTTECLLLNAAKLYKEGDVKSVIKILKKVLKDLQQPKTRMQRLPLWVQRGVFVEWVGSGQHLVYEIIRVDRSCANWSFVGVRRISEKANEVITFHRESGKRYWRRYGC